MRAKRISVAALALVLIVALAGSFLLNSVEYVAIYTELPDYEQTEIVAQLSEMGVDVRFDGAGRIMVPKEQEAVVRMQLATAGYPKNGLSYYNSSENSSVLTTDYARKQNQYKDYQERLGATIKTLDGVRDAIVNIPMPSESVFYLQDQSPPTASVTVHMNEGRSLTQNQVAGIRNIVASSIPGLTLENISIVDGYGNDLLSEYMTGAGSGLEYTRQYESDIRKKVLGVLTGPYAYEDLRVEASAVVNRNPSFVDRRTYYPSPDGDNTGVVSREANTAETYNSTEGDANVPGTDTNAQVPQYPTGAGGGETSSTGNSSEREYLVSDERVQTVNNGDTIESVTVAVAVNRANFAPGEAASIARLAAAAANIPEENVTVVNFGFPGDEEPDEETPESGGLGRYLIFGFIAGAVLLIALVILLLLLRRRKKAAEAAALAEAEAAAAAAAAEAEAAMIEYDEEGHPISSPNVEIGPITPLRDKRREEIQEFAKHNPEITAQMIKTLLKSEEGN